MTAERLAVKTPLTHVMSVTADLGDSKQIVWWRRRGRPDICTADVPTNIPGRETLSPVTPMQRVVPIEVSRFGLDLPELDIERD